MRIRPYHPADFLALAMGSAESGWGLLTPAERLRTRQDLVARRSVTLIAQALRQPGSVVLVAEAFGLPVGYEFLSIRPDEVSGIPEALKLDGWVAPSFRGRGLNRLLHDAGEEYCRALGIERMIAVIAAQNRSSLRATEKAGFVTEKVVRAKWLTQDLGAPMPK